MKPKVATAGRIDRRASRTSASRRDKLDFGFLVNAIRQVHEHCLIHVGKAVNTTVTLRNWAIGFYIREYEQRGSDRAAYGAGLLEALSERLVRIGVGGLAPRTLRQCRQFYLTYPKIWQSLTAKSSERTPDAEIWQSLSAKFPGPLPSAFRGAAKKQESATRISSVDPKTLVSRLSFTHLAELIAVDDPFKRKIGRAHV